MRMFLAIGIVVAIGLVTPTAASVPSGAAVTGTEGDLIGMLLIRNDDNSVDCFMLVFNNIQVSERVAVPNFCTNNSAEVAALAKVGIEAYQAAPISDPLLERMKAELEAAGYTVTGP